MNKKLLSVFIGIIFLFCNWVYSSDFEIGSPWTKSSTNVFLNISTDNVGIGTNTPSSKLHMLKTDSAGAFTGTLNQSTFGTNMVAAQINMNSTGSTNSAVIKGAATVVQHLGANSTVTAGVVNENQFILNSSTVGTTSFDFGVIGLSSIFNISASNNRTYTISDYSSVNILSVIGPASGLVTITNDYVGLNIENPAPDGTPLTVSGDLIGIQVDEQTGAGGNNYEIFLANGGGIFFNQVTEKIESTNINHLDLYASTSIDLNSHIKTSGSSPTLSACGIAPAIVGSDSAGKVTIGTGVTNSCTATFNVAYVIAPACTLTGSANGEVIAGTTTTTALIITSGSDMDSDVIMYICIEL